MLKRLLYGLLGLLLVSIAIFLTLITAYLVRSEVLPALAQGSFDVTTSTRILERVWRGNEIYILLGGYATAAVCALTVGLRCAVKSYRG